MPKTLQRPGEKCFRVLLEDRFGWPWYPTFAAKDMLEVRAKVKVVFPGYTLHGTVEIHPSSIHSTKNESGGSRLKHRGPPFSANAYTGWGYMTAQPAPIERRAKDEEADKVAS